MKASASLFRQQLIRPTWLAQGLYQAETLLCTALCALIAAIFWGIALICFAAWFVYQSLRVALWLLGLLWRIATWPIKVMSIAAAAGLWLVWLAFVWVGGRVYQLWGWQRLALRTLVVWAIHEFGEAFVCTFFVYMGVLTTGFLPSALLLHFSPAALFGLALTPLAAFAIAARVFDTRAYQRWRRGARTRLGVRVLKAYSDGLIWARWLRRPARVRPSWAA